MARSGTNRGSDLLNQIEAIIEEELANGTTTLARRVTTRIALEFGGEQIYLPKDKARRDARIFDEYTGDNVLELRARYKLSESTLYQVIRAERSRRRLRQGVLPGVFFTGGRSMSQEQTKRHLVTKAELIKDVLRITREEDARDLHAVDVEVVLDALAEACAARLAAGDDVMLPGIGRLKVKARAARMVRNPRTGEPMSLPPKRGVTFNAGKKLLVRIE